MNPDAPVTNIFTAEFAACAGRSKRTCEADEERRWSGKQETIA